MGTRLRPALLLAAVLTAACDQPVNPHVEWPPGANWDDYGAEHCPAQCAQLEVLACPEAKPTPRGVTCSESCQVLLNRAVWTPTDVACVRAARTQDEVRKCRVRCRAA